MEKLLSDQGACQMWADSGRVSEGGIEEKGWKQFFRGQYASSPIEELPALLLPYGTTFSDDDNHHLLTDLKPLMAFQITSRTTTPLASSTPPSTSHTYVYVQARIATDHGVLSTRPSRWHKTRHEEVVVVENVPASVVVRDDATTESGAQSPPRGFFVVQSKVGSPRPHTSQRLFATAAGGTDSAAGQPHPKDQGCAARSCQAAAAIERSLSNLSYERYHAHQQPTNKLSFAYATCCVRRSGLPTMEVKSWLEPEEAYGDVT
ncbi:hypothetical protein EDB83DRAFT_2558654 [Lactarius deliciosus]|nr:hypothetical protein EDB83DRAFT_2558654 [Lactarius deliciosus]